jgi:hypothetical protein
VAQFTLSGIAAVLGHGLPDVLYFAQRLGTVFEEAPRRYIAAIACGLGIAIGALAVVAIVALLVVLLGR